MEDLGKTSLAVLLVLCLLISIVSTFMVLDSLNTPKPIVSREKVAERTGSVRLSIAPEMEAQKVEQQGSVVLSIQR
jgi:hypothetical protein